MTNRLTVTEWILFAAILRYVLQFTLLDNTGPGRLTDIERKSANRYQEYRAGRQNNDWISFSTRILG